MTRLHGMTRALLLFSALSFAIACGTTAKPKGGSSEIGADGGSGNDGGGTTDAGVDGGSGTDGGTETDGGIAAPIIRSVTPPRSPAAGGFIVTISGKRFVDGFAETGGQDASAATNVWFGSNQVAQSQVKVIDDATLEVTTPPGQRGVVDVKLRNPNGDATCTGCFSYVEDVRITKLSTTRGSTLGGEPLTIFGTGFASGMMVLVGGSEATNVNVSSDGTRIDVLTPPGVAGSADVGVVGEDNADFLRRGFVYVAPISITSVSPPGAPLSGGGTATVKGAGFTADSIVSFGSQAVATTFVSATQLSATIPAAAQAGAIDVVVNTARGQGKLANGFAYYDSSRDPQIFAVMPATGPTAGGARVQVVGTGLSGDGLLLKFGVNDATNVSGDDHIVNVTTPAGAPGLVDVQARTARGGAVLSGGYGYVSGLTLTSITPNSAPASTSSPVQATLRGSGLDGACHVFIGAGEATVNGTLPGGSGLLVTVPEGSPGVRDVRVTCGAADSLLYQETTLANGFTYTSPLKILKLDPESGAIAGNTAVNLYGSGFDAGMLVYFGNGKAPIVDVKSPHWAVVRTPRGSVGFVDVKVKVGTVEDTLRQGFGYTNPANPQGGGSGGPMRGILNVTVLNSTQGMEGQPVDGVTISINSDQLMGVTDDRGQVTFSDASLLKPVTITGTKARFASTSVARIDARNVTLFMEMNDPDPPTPSDGPIPEPATFSGRVCGFKLPPGMPLKRGQRLEAHVFMSAPYVYRAPPFARAPTPIVVTSDCGSFGFGTRQYGAFAAYAEFGILDTTTAPQTFTPLLMGIKRGLEASPGKVQEGIDIVLDMHRDLSFPVTIDENVMTGQTVMNNMFSYLDLGGEGVIPLAQQQSAASQFQFNNHPQIGGEGLILLNVATMVDPVTGGLTMPFSYFFRRQYGELSAGVRIGPMLAVTKMTTPTAGGVFTGTLGWTFLAGPRPQIQKLSIDQPVGPSALKPIWSAALPGSEQGVAVPASANSTFPPDTALQWTLFTATTPRLDFNEFSYNQLFVNEWTAFTWDEGSFVTSP